MKAKVIAIVNQKGGVAKTTTAAALLTGLTERGYKVLAIDLDGQRANLSFITQANTTGATSFGILTKEVSIEQAIQETPQGEIVAANKSLVGIDAILTQTGKEYRLKEAIEPIINNYDYIVIDTPPMLNILTVNALTVADKVIVPLGANILDLQGVKDLADTMKPIKQYCNPQLKLEGLLFTRYSPRTVLAKNIKEVAGQLAKELGTKIFKNTIRDAIAQKEAQALGESIYTYAKSSKVTADYNSFINELLGEKHTK